MSELFCTPGTFSELLPQGCANGTWNDWIVTETCLKITCIGPSMAMSLSLFQRILHDWYNIIWYMIDMIQHNIMSYGSCLQGTFSFHTAFFSSFQSIYGAWQRIGCISKNVNNTPNNLPWFFLIYGTTHLYAKMLCSKGQYSFQCCNVIRKGRIEEEKMEF